MITSPTHRILIIDDNPSIHTDLRKILIPPSSPSRNALLKAEEVLFGDTIQAVATATAPFEIDSAYQGQEGLELVHQSLANGKPYAIAFVDIRMPPGWDGLETITHLWACDPNLHIIICTAYSDYTYEDLLQRFGRSDKLVILKKPFDNIEVIQLATALSQKWNLIHRLNSQFEDLDHLVANRTSEIEQVHQRLQSEKLEREQTVQALKLSEARFSCAFSKSHIPMALQALETGVITDVNDAFLRWLGYEREDLVGDSAASQRLWAQPGIQSDLYLALRMRGSTRMLEGGVRAADGTVRQAILSAERLDTGSEPHALIIAQDVTPTVRLEQQLRQAQKMESVGRLAGGVAHDFNNMLTIIQGHVHLLSQSRRPQSQVLSSLDHIASVTDRAARLTRQLLTFSHKEAAAPKVLNLNEVLSRLTSMLRHIVGEHIEWECHLCSESPLIEANESELEQVIMHLVINARDAMPKGGEISLRTRITEVDSQKAENPNAGSGWFVCLSIKDTGAGMDAETLAHIFDLNFHARQDTSPDGMNLATVNNIIQQHGGWIDVASAPGQGSTFRVYLPAVQQQYSSKLFAPIPVPSSKKDVVLLVEDEPLMRELVNTVLIRDGWSVIQAADGFEALEAWKGNSERIALLLTDLHLTEKLSGIDLVKKLQAQCPDLKTLIISGEPDLASGHMLGDEVRFMSKPFKVSALLETVRDFLRYEKRCVA